VTIASVADLERALGDAAYLSDHGLAVTTWLALTLDRPLLLEGQPGVGKTELARTLATVLGRRLIRLQCYEGIDASQALYEWDYARQLLYARSVQDGGRAEADLATLYGPGFLVERPLLAAVRAGDGALLLIDELDRADDEFEAFLLEVLADFQVTIPEVGTVAAPSPPMVVITSNRTRELHDALKRRCLFHWIDYPDPAREAEIVLLRAPGVGPALAHAVAAAVARLRDADLAKPPGPAEAVDWARAVHALGGSSLEEEVAQATLGALVKNADDLALARRVLPEVL
jgi:MoxR-like ATPase